MSEVQRILQISFLKSNSNSHTTKEINGNVVPIQFAIQNMASIDIVLELLDNCGDITVNHQDISKETSLHYAAWRPSSLSGELVKLIFKHGVDASIRNSENMTAEEIAGNKNYHYLRYLIM